MRLDSEGKPVPIEHYQVPAKRLPIPPAKGDDPTQLTRQIGRYVKVSATDSAGDVHIQYIALLMCPECGTPQVLEEGIALDGSVIPLCICSKPGCSFARFIRLENWPKQEASKKFFAMAQNPLDKHTH